jgi:hypothetical protein
VLDAPKTFGADGREFHAAEFVARGFRINDAGIHIGASVALF